MMTPTADIANRLAHTQPGISQENVAEKSGAGQGNEVSADFRAHLDNGNKLQVNPAHGAAQNEQVNSVESTRRVNRGSIPDKQSMMPGDVFGQFDKIRGEFDAFLKRSGELDKAVAEGKLKFNDPKVMQQRREEMRMLLHFQTEMQGTAMKVEVASKVIEGSTSAINKTLSTQA